MWLAVATVPYPTGVEIFRPICRALVCDIIDLKGIKLPKERTFTYPMWSVVDATVLPHRYPSSILTLDMLDILTCNHNHLDLWPPLVSPSSMSVFQKFMSMNLLTQFRTTGCSGVRRTKYQYYSYPWPSYSTEDGRSFRELWACEIWWVEKLRLGEFWRGLSWCYTSNDRLS